MAGKLGCALGIGWDDGAAANPQFLHAVQALACLVKYSACVCVKSNMFTEVSVAAECVHRASKATRRPSNREIPSDVVLCGHRQTHAQATQCPLQT